MLGDVSVVAEWNDREGGYEGLATALAELMTEIDQRVGAAVQWQLAGTTEILHSKADLLRWVHPELPPGVSVAPGAHDPERFKTWQAVLVGYGAPRKVSLVGTWDPDPPFSSIQRVDLTVEGDADPTALDLGAALYEACMATLPAEAISARTMETIEQLAAPAPEPGAPDIGWRTWLQDVAPADLDGTGATNIKTVGAGVQFDLATTDIAAAEQLLISRGVLRSLHQPTLFAGDPIPEPDPTFRTWVTGVVARPGGGLPAYVVQHPDGQPVAFHGHVWREGPSGAPVEVYLTSVGGYAPYLSTDLDTRGRLQQHWLAEATRQQQVIPAGAVNEWHTDDPVTSQALYDVFVAHQIPITIGTHPAWQQHW